MFRVEEVDGYKQFTLTCEVKGCPNEETDHPGNGAVEVVVNAVTNGWTVESSLPFNYKTVKGKCPEHKYA